MFLIPHSLWRDASSSVQGDDAVRAALGPELLLVVIVAKLCPTLYDPMDCSLPGSSVRRISQARMLGWVACSFSRAKLMRKNGKSLPFLSRDPGRNCFSHPA